MARLCWVAILATTGCSAVFGIGDPQPAPPDGPPASCAIAGFDLCAHQQPNGPITFGSDIVIDTTLDCNLVLFDPQGGSVCVIYASDLTVGATIRAHGPRPLVLAAQGTITITGTIDVSSGTLVGIGAGANHPSCAVKQPPGVDSGGAAGGSFHGKGGTGGNGGTGASSGGVAADALASVDIIRGGCPGGGLSGSGQTGDIGANGGASGGAVAIIAASAISISSTGRVFASGEGGEGSHDFSNMTILGAAGGGSGGLVELVAPTVTVAGVIAANGGGGGEGTDGPGVKAGNRGADGTQNDQPANGGAGGGGGGDGGKSSAGSTLAGSPGINGGGAGLGGGGGGGGAGFVVITSPALVTTGATISPPAS